MLRVQPIHLQGTIENTWQPILARLKPDLVDLTNSDAESIAAHAASL